MKKVLSVAMASAMVLGMGANAFAIQYASGSSDTAAWPAGFQFDGKMFVTNKDGDIVTGSNTKLDGKTRINFNEGDTIWMPLYANNQKEYTVVGDQVGLPAVAAGEVTFNPVLDNLPVEEELVSINHRTGKVNPFEYRDNQNKVLYWYNDAVTAKAPSLTPAEEEAGWRTARIVDYKDNYGKTQHGVKVMLNGAEVTTISAMTTNETTNVPVVGDLKVQVNYNQAADAYSIWLFNGTDYNTKELKNDGSSMPTSYSYYNFATGVTAPAQYNSVTYDEVAPLIPDAVWDAAKATATATRTGFAKTTVPVEAGFTTTTAPVLKAGVEVVAYLPEVAEQKEDLGEIEEGKWETDGNYFVNTVAYGHYTGNIDKNWSINLIEEDNGVADLIDHAELYKADEVDYLSYKDYTTEIMPNAVYLKVELKDTWKLAKAADLKYYVYVADNKSGKETNKVWVSGKYEASNVQTVDFTWTNDASQPAVWKVAKNENGIAVFDFADKAFFQVKMYAGESMYLDLSTAYDAAMAGDFDEADQFFAFDNENANFSRTGTLILVSDDASLVPYQVTEDGYTKVDAEYVEDFVIAHTNEKVDGFVFETKELGNYVLATDELEVEEDNKDDNTQEVVVPDDDNKETNNNSKPNPITGAEDFVGLAVSLAVVSVAAAGALALKK